MSKNKKNSTSKTEAYLNIVLLVNYILEIIAKFYERFF
jgi:hypothetical protein